MTSTDVGLRELKKQETRQLISDQATLLFIEKGFEETTIAEIAAAARVAKKTVTNYFARKEDLALDQHEEFTNGLANAVRDRKPGESALAALRRTFLDAVAEHSPVIGFTGPVFAKMVLESPTLTARLRELHELREAALAELLASETGADADDVTPVMAAAELNAIDRVLFREVLRRSHAGESNEEIAAALTKATQRAFELLEPAFGDYAIRE
ncbi:TetR/AcrR family transcriptional regulator [Amycolatopsis roodepoortensis]|uniref:AcrR family transcriptional regulator n=1 Tax=Amycolatopsis roodepoortensis TaxID=700274 RepID=A0ABR9LLH5_9PSEU|nr:TetR family transcriptional regulator [Amycolatopsis roodepoortensis]MBE1581467.1 AcrR family transcriptional regulator [Amycolatopsis roodepoortensis]